MLDRLQGPTDQRAAHGADLTALRIARWLLVLLLITSYPVAGLLPSNWGWENGTVENAQIAVLLLGFVHALRRWASMPRRDVSTGLADSSASVVRRRLAAVAMPFWLLCAIRETSWGATLLTVALPTPEGPYFTSRLLWYHPLILPAVLVVVVGMGIAFFRWRLAKPLRDLMRHRQFPWPELGLAVVAALLSVSAEGKLPFMLPGTETTLAVLEEWAELLCYASLVLMQARIFFALCQSGRPTSL